MRPARAVACAIGVLVLAAPTAAADDGDGITPYTHGLLECTSLLLVEVYRILAEWREDIAIFVDQAAREVKCTLANANPLNAVTECVDVSYTGTDRCITM